MSSRSSSSTGGEISRAFLDEVVGGEKDLACLRLEAGVVGTGRNETLRSLRDRVEGEEDELDDGALRTEAS